MSYNPFSLRDKTILVTGASSGIGRAISIECSKMGANIIATARNKERLEETISALEEGNHKQFLADINVEDDLKGLIDFLPPLDGVVLCAGIGETILLRFAKRKKINSMFETNFFAQIELLRLLQTKKLVKNGGSVIAISSIGGNYSFDLGNGPYGATKAALSSWMKFAAQEFASREIRANSICPGMIHTPLADDNEILSKEDLLKYSDEIPLKRFGKPEEVAWAAIYLLSDASKWVTGTEIIIDGGTTL